MSKIVFLLLLITECNLLAQMQKFEITVEKEPPQPPVFVNYPDDAAVIIYSSIEGLNFESNTAGIVDTKTEPGKYTLVVKTEKQFISVKKRNYMEGRITIPKLEARQVLYFSITEKSPDAQILPVTILTTPAECNIYIDGTFSGTGAQHQLTEGIHTIRVEKTGYAAIEKSIEVSKQKALFEFTLEKEKQYPVTIRSEPKGARIFIDNVEQQEKTDHGLFLFTGTYTLRLTLPGYLDISEEIRIGSNEPAERKYSFIKNSGVLSVKVTPADAEIYINNQPEQLQQGRKELLPGEHTLRISKTGYFPVEEKVIIELGKTTHKSFTLQKNTGSLKLVITPPDAEIYINRAKQNAGSKYFELAPGKYALEIKREGYNSREETIEIELNREVEKSFTLVQKTGSLQFSISPVDADVQLIRSGAVIEKWQGLKIIDNLSVGTYTIEAKAAGYKTKKEDVEVKENQNTVIKTVLEKGADAKGSMILVKGGWFNMGSNDGQDNEKPVHKVWVDDFYIGKYEVTVAEFAEFIKATGYKTDAEKGDGSYIWTGSEWQKKAGVSWRDDVSGKKRKEIDYNHPVIHVSWNDADAYCKWKGVRLPTEAEWEYAARGGQQSKGYKYSGSNSIDEVAWYKDNSNDQTHAVGSKKPNELGIYDMTGNVWEWCSDRYAQDYYSKSPERNPGGPVSGQYRILRGGSWVISDDDCRAAYRNDDTPDFRFNDVGFRAASAP